MLLVWARSPGVTFQKTNLPSAADPMPSHLLTHSVDQSPSWEVNRFSANQELPRILWNPKFIIAITSARHLFLSWGSSMQSIPPRLTSWKSILILSSHTRLGLPSCLFPCAIGEFNSCYSAAAERTVLDIDTSHTTQCGVFHRSCFIFHSFPAKYDGHSTVHSNWLRVLCKPFSKSSANSSHFSAVCLKYLQSALLRRIFVFV